MPYCPDCGRHVAPGDDTCAECGQSISAALAAGRDDGGPDKGDQRPARDGPEERDGSRSRRDQGQDPIKRRRALAAAGGVLGTTVVGVYAIERFGSDGPKEVVGAWRTAWVTGDTSTFRTLWHPDATQPDTWPADALDRPSTPDDLLFYVGEDRELLERTETTATVRDVFALGHPEFDTEYRHHTEVDLRTVDSNWRVFEERLEQTEPVTCRRYFSITGSDTFECQ